MEDNDIIKPGSGPDGRLVAEYLRLRRTYAGHYRRGIANLWMTLARRFKRPIREIKPVIQRYKDQNPERFTNTSPKNHD